MKISVKKIKKKAQLPSQGTNYAAGADLYACIDENITLNPGETKIIGTGIIIEIPDGYAGFIYARSGLGINKGLVPGNCVGVIDSDYRGEIMIGLYNHSKDTHVIEPDMRIAQLVIAPYLKAEYQEVEEISDTKRGENRFGSTGEK